MFVILVFMFAGILLGYLLRKIRICFINGAILTLIWLLLFLLGVEVGFNDQVIRKFGTLGMEAILIAALATLGSIAGAGILLRPEKLSVGPVEKKQSKTQNSFAEVVKGLKGSLVILAFFVAGLLIGIFRLFIFFCFCLHS